MSDLLVTAYTPTLGTGRALRTFGVVAAMARHRHVDVLYQRFDAPHPAPAYAALRGVALHGVEASRRAGRVAAVARARMAGAPLDLARGASPELLERARRLARGAERVVADGPTAAASLLPLAREREVVYLAHNLESSLRENASLARFERELFETYSECWVPTAADATAARRIAPSALLRRVRNVVDVRSIVAQTAARGDGRILLVADYTYPPNRDGADFLAREILPLVREQRPGATLALAGRGLDRPPAGEGIEVLGFVTDLAATYASADAVAVPMRRGGGSPLKFVEALAHGVPVVATDHAAALLESGRAGEHFLAAAGAPGFADALVRALRGEACDVAAAGRALVEREYSIESLAQDIAP